MLQFLTLILSLWSASSWALTPELVQEGRGQAEGAESSWVRINIQTDDFQGRLLGLKMYWYHGEEDIQAVAAKGLAERFQLGTAAVINHGYTSDMYWYRLLLFNPLAESQTIYLHDPHNVYDSFEVYQEQQLIGDLHYADSLPKRIVPIVIAAKSLSTIYIRKKASAVVHQASWTLWRDRAELRQSIHQSELDHRTLVTVYFMSLFFTGALLFAYRNILYLYYMAYLLSFGVFSTWVWSVYYVPYFAQLGGVLSHFCIVFTALFVMEFLEFKRYAPKLLIFLKVAAALAFLSMALYFVNPLVRTYAGTAISITIQLVTFGFGTLQYLRYRQIHVLIFNTAFGCFLLGGFVQMLIWVGVVDSANNLILFYGVGVENILMLVAMGYKIGVTESALKQSRDQLVHSYEQLSKVFYPHQILQIREGRKIEETMPVGEQDACVIYFKMVGGSSLMHEVYEECVESFMIRCRQLVMDHYDPKVFTSNAYMIREMGDGFLCSVGYPFHQNGRLKSLAAVELAGKIVSEFEHFLQALDAPIKMYCTIGIARGMVKSYFSKSGRIRDDLWGRAIILASNYGDLSEGLFEATGREPETVMILHDAVYESLPHGERQKFELMPVDQTLQVPGKDLDGENLAFRLFPGGSASINRKAG